MLDQQYAVITSTDSHESTYVNPLLIQVLNNDKLGICCERIAIDFLSSSYGKTKGDRFKLSIPYAKQNLTWNVFFDSECPEMGPDFIFNDDTFLADMDVNTLSSNVPSLANWNPNDKDALLNVLTELLSCYKQYQIQLLQKQDRLEIEYSMLIQSMEVKPEDVEMILLPLASKPTEAKFLIRLSIDVSQLPNRTCESESDVAMLFVTFCGTDWNRIIPQLYLSKSLEGILGGSAAVHLPHFSCNTSLVDYVSEIKKCIAGKINALVQSLEKRRNFVTAMIAKMYDSQLEYDAINYSYMSMLLSHQDFCVVLSIQLLPGFPRDQPLVQLQSIYHFTKQGDMYSEAIKNFPYNHQWDPCAMVEKLLKHIMENINEFKHNSVATVLH